MPRKPAKKAKAKAEVKVKVKPRPQPKPKPKPKPKPQIKKISSNFQGLTIRQIASAISGYLMQYGYDPVLTGRACAAVYLGASVKAKSLDFVLTEYEVPELGDVMKAIGFSRKGLYTFVSKKCPVDVFFSPPPLAVGDDLVRKIEKIRIKGGSIKLLSPTDCCRQRLSMYYRWGDLEAFDEAVALAEKHELDLELVKKWSDWEWCSDRYEEFEKKLEGERSKVKGQR